MKKMVEKLSIVFALCLLFALSPVNVFSAEEVEVEVGTTVQSCMEDCQVVKAQCVEVCDEVSECVDQCALELEDCSETCKTMN